MKTANAVSFAVSLVLAATVHAEGPKATQPQGTAAQKPAGGTVSDPRSPDGNMMGTMMEYQKDVNKEAREDRKSGRFQKETVHNAKGSKLKEQAQQIDAQKSEAKQKSDRATAAASKAPAPVRKPCTALDPC